MRKKYNLIDFNKSGRNTICIIGFGASGLISACNLIKNEKTSIKIDIFDKSNSNGLGIAYSTENISHLLNVRAENMSIFQDEPEHFTNWLQNNGYQYSAKDFVPRMIYGKYLQSTFIELRSKSSAKISIIQENVNTIQQHGNIFEINDRYYKSVIIATGFDKDTSVPQTYSLKQYLNKNEILIKGAGLTAIDNCLSLKNLGFTGKIRLFSRSGKMSDYHTNCKALANPIISTEEVRNLPLYKIFALFKSRIRKLEDHRSGFESIRNTATEIWQNFSEYHKNQFNRHLLRRFSLYRHKIPTESYKIIEDMMKNKQLTVEKASNKTKYDIISTGYSIEKINTNLATLTKNINNTDSLHKIGVMNADNLFESIAIPEIRKQAQEVSLNILSK